MNFVTNNWLNEPFPTDEWGLQKMVQFFVDAIRISSRNDCKDE